MLPNLTAPSFIGCDIKALNDLLTGSAAHPSGWSNESRTSMGFYQADFSAYFIIASANTLRILCGQCLVWPKINTDMLCASDSKVD